MVGWDQNKNKIGGVAWGAEYRAPALRPPSPHDGVMTQSAGTRSNGMRSSHNRWHAALSSKLFLKLYSQECEDNGRYCHRYNTFSVYRYRLVYCNTLIFRSTI